MNSCGVVKDHSQRVAVTGAQATDPVAHVDAEAAARPPHRPMMHREDHALALRKRHDLGARLHARPLLRENEFASGEILARPRQQERDLQRKDEIAVEVLMQAIEIAKVTTQVACI